MMAEILKYLRVLASNGRIPIAALTVFTKNFSARFSSNYRTSHFITPPGIGGTGRSIHVGTGRFFDRRNAGLKRRD